MPTSWADKRIWLPPLQQNRLTAESGMNDYTESRPLSYAYGALMIVG